MTCLGARADAGLVAGMAGMDSRMRLVQSSVDTWRHKGCSIQG